MGWLRRILARRRVRATTPDFPAWAAQIDASLAERARRRRAAADAARTGAATKVHQRFRDDRLRNEQVIF